MSEAAGADAGAVDGTVVVGLVVAAGVVQPTAAPPREAARARASRIRLIMAMGFLRCQGVGGSGASRGRRATTTTDLSQRDPTNVWRPGLDWLQGSVIREPGADAVRRAARRTMGAAGGAAEGLWARVQRP